MGISRGLKNSWYVHTIQLIKNERELCMPTWEDTHNIVFYFEKRASWIVYIFSSVQSLSHVWLFATPWSAARQASLSITNSQRLLKLMSIELVMPSNHLILSFSSHPQSFQASGPFKWVSSSHEVAKVLQFQLQHQSFQWVFRTDFL